MKRIFQNGPVRLQPVRTSGRPFLVRLYRPQRRAPRPGEPLVRGQGARWFDRTELDTILWVAGVDTVVLAGIATDLAVESTAPCIA